ncbi:hypothetical protein [Agrobacterium larrymoorei]|uniref:Alkylated DNA repair dioxygenase AlkB n=1 Tax=Agrobacterium larrymoorei TaxID=160699 RepID=A0AAJ2ERG5_9HYPH|nr:hypothetical protein [Agrobacterium larrymoorei]MDQ1185815.1 alkylated DNA repair dioxygenase AlkB [Agrobacterium larrymoorei]MDR6102086.1 alkylated DNA repair dioxygenase AlkB [Agrobacterium larrymoorei]
MRWIIAFLIAISVSSEAAPEQATLTNEQIIVRQIRAEMYKLSLNSDLLALQDQHMFVSFTINRKGEIESVKVTNHKNSSWKTLSAVQQLFTTLKLKYVPVAMRSKKFVVPVFVASRQPTVLDMLQNNGQKSGN